MLLKQQSHKIIKTRKISIITPVFNEEKSIKQLTDEVKIVMKGSPYNLYELIVVNDGSEDKTLQIIKRLDSVISLRMPGRSGQSAALQEGIAKSSGDTIVTLDGDGQNDPRDIPRLVRKLEEGYDMVCGWRYKRDDSLDRLIASTIAYYLRRIMLNDDIHDSGCGLKVFRRKCIEDFVLENGYHRFLPWIMERRGFKVTEIKVNHRPRKHGKSKYPVSRYITALSDLFYIRNKYR